MQIIRKVEELEVFTISEIDKRLPEVKAGDVIELELINHESGERSFMTFMFANQMYGNGAYLIDLSSALVYQTKQSEILSKAGILASNKKICIGAKVFKNSALKLN